jgi:TPP-dependent pyruvate/acetoin dehydrogenase alpha subunit
VQRAARVHVRAEHIFTVVLLRKKACARPTFVELVTYRLGGHSTSDDPTRYRSQEEVEISQVRDPIARLGAYLRANDVLSEGDQRHIGEEAEREVNSAVAEVESIGPPAASSLFDDVYGDVPWHLAEQRRLADEFRPTKPGVLCTLNRPLADARALR